MKRKLKAVLLLLALILIPLWTFGDPPVYFAKDIRGQVVDAETGKPLEGVVVVARWIFSWIRLGDGGSGGTINTLEAVTDKDGKYVIPGWGPRPRWPFAFLADLDPELRFFKSSYYPEGVANELFSYKNHNRDMMRTSDWDGKVVKLKPFKGDDWKDYGAKVSYIWSSGGSDCLRACPHYILVLDAENKRIKMAAQKVWASTSGVDIGSFSKSDQEFLKRIKDGK